MEPGARASSRIVPVVALAALVGAIVLFGVLRSAVAAHVAPELIAGSSNKTCSELARAGQTWKELKVDPPANGQKSDGTLTVTITNLTNTKTFDWSSNIGVDAVFVKAGSEGSYLYRYDDPTSGSDPGEQTGDTGLTSPGAGTSNQISHIAFCYDVEQGASPSPSPSVSPSETPTQSPSPSPSPSVSPSETPTESPTPTPTESPSVLPTQIVSPSPTVTTSVLGGQLGRTGADIIRFAVLALALIGLGIASYIVANRASRGRT